MTDPMTRTIAAAVRRLRELQDDPPLNPKPLTRERLAEIELMAEAMFIKMSTKH